MTNAALNSFIGQIDTFSFRDKLFALRAILRSFGFPKKQKNTPKSDFLYGLLKDSEYTLETARAERLSSI